MDHFFKTLKETEDVVKSLQSTHEHLKYETEMIVKRQKTEMVAQTSEENAFENNLKLLEKQHFYNTIKKL